MGYFIIMKEPVRVIRDPDKIRICIETTRNKILSLLNVENMTISQLSEALSKDQSTVYRHVKKLEKHGLVMVCGEKKEHHIPEKIYGRTAGMFLMIPQSNDMEDDHEERWRKESMQRSLDVLDLIGYHNEGSDELIEKVNDFFIKFGSKTADYFEENNEVGEIDNYTLRIVEMLLLLLEVKNDDKLNQLKREIIPVLDS